MHESRCPQTLILELLQEYAFCPPERLGNLLLDQVKREVRTNHEENVFLYHEQKRGHVVLIKDMM